MIESFRNIFAIPDLRKRVLFMFALLGVYRVGCNIPTPGIDPQALLEFMVPESIVCFIEPPSDEFIPSWRSLVLWTFFMSERKAWVFRDFSLVLRISSAFSPLMRASRAMRPWMRLMSATWRLISFYRTIRSLSILIFRLCLPVSILASI